MSEVTVPQGYMKNRKGHLVEEKLVDPYDLEMNAFVLKHTKRALELQAALRQFKQDVYEDCAAFQELLAEKYDTKVGGSKGGVSFTSYDGKTQIRICVQDRITMGPELQVAEVLVKECANEWVEGARSELKALVHKVFETDKEGNISASKILEFRRDYKSVSDDERWLKAMDAIGDAIKVVGSKSYLNFKERNAEGKYLNIPLDISKL
ncbi:DUF3164 family protein [Vibrio parahaemolyticus]|uniref:DUF3164 family protein n=1 Tax=Vibrio parahaemolyticus TaxID=670 RepID=A0A7Y0XCQ6_VIBPH|nr:MULTISPECIES: DUF3164 family protein [Vibrio harveyi group]AYO22462.1 DUF3164 family protein [Vibrio owensii]MDF5045564.1 DUF3164 family protein [Vibrio parahaemolyticus]MDF5234469.1 DUF3164 family protein [Vibrio parahaemolyticus]MDF5243712.1 DUF3164 family protein [Vibrio parahaemolyticus]MDF5256988.1 DUF3164 family protein [Vibrio parahaemolyticus]